MHRLQGETVLATCGSPTQGEAFFSRGLTSRVHRRRSPASFAPRPASRACGAIRANALPRVTSSPALQLVHRGLLHWRPEGRNGAARRAELVASGQGKRDAQRESQEPALHAGNEHDAALTPRVGWILDQRTIGSDCPADYGSLCTSSEPIGQVGTGIKRGSGPSELKFWLQDGAAGVCLRWFSV